MSSVSYIYLLIEEIENLYQTITQCLKISKALHTNTVLEKVLSCSTKSSVITALHSLWSNLSYTLYLHSSGS